MAKFLWTYVRHAKPNRHDETTHLCDRRNRNAQPNRNETDVEISVTSTKKMGIIHSSRSFSDGGV